MGMEKTFSNAAMGHVVNPPPSTKGYNDLQEMLGQQRQIDHIQGDGNCLFRAISKELLGHEKFHYLIRQIIVKFIKANSERFQEYLIEGKMETHVQRMENLGHWGTSMEIYSAATMLRTEVYVFSKQPNSPHYKWLCYHPQPTSRFTFQESEVIQRVSKLTPRTY
jgi:hypothetical protein